MSDAAKAIIKASYFFVMNKGTKKHTTHVTSDNPEHVAEMWRAAGWTVQYARASEDGNMPLPKKGA